MMNSNTTVTNISTQRPPDFESLDYTSLFSYISQNHDEILEWWIFEVSLVSNKRLNICFVGVPKKGQLI